MLQTIQCEEYRKNGTCALSTLFQGKKGRNECGANFNHKTGKCSARPNDNGCGCNCKRYLPETSKTVIGKRKTEINHRKPRGVQIRLCGGRVASESQYKRIIQLIGGNNAA